MVVLGIDIGGAQIRAGWWTRTARSSPPARSRRRRIWKVSSLAAGRNSVAARSDGSSRPVSGSGARALSIRTAREIEVLPGTLHFLEGLRLVDLVGLPLDVPVFADNAARVALAGEMVWGAARGRKNVMMLTLGAGVGGAVLANGHLLRGHSGVAGHLGHVTVEPEGRPVRVRESRLSGNGVLGARDRRRRRGRRCTAGARRHSRACSATSRNWPRAARSFRRRARATTVAHTIVSDAIHKLAAGLAGLLHVFDPEIVILGGQLADAGADLLVRCRRRCGSARGGCSAGMCRWSSRRWRTSRGSSGRRAW